MNHNFTFKHKSAVIIGIAMMLIMVYSVIAQNLDIVQVSSVGEIKTSSNLAVFRDVNLSEEVTLVDWGTITPNNPVTKTLYLYNKGTTSLTLYFYAANWTPAEAENVVNITWNRENTVLEPKEAIAITLTATCGENPNFIKNFENILFFGGI